MSDLWWWISGCVTTVALAAILVGGPASCTVRIQQQATKRVAEVCSGNLKSDPVRAAACILAIKDARRAGM